MGSGSRWIYQDSSEHLGYQSELESITSAASQLTWWWFCHAYSATAELLVLPFCTTLRCSFIQQARERPDWPIDALLQSLHGILYTTPFRSLVGMGSFGLTRIWRSDLFGLNLTWIPVWAEVYYLRCFPVDMVVVLPCTFCHSWTTILKLPYTMLPYIQGLSEPVKRILQELGVQDVCLSLGTSTGNQTPWTEKADLSPDLLYPTVRTET